MTGRGARTAKDKAEEVITRTLDLAEKKGTLSGTIKSSHGDFPIVGGSREGEKVTPSEFDVGRPTGSISLRMTDDRLGVGTWNTGIMAARWTSRKSQHKRLRQKAVVGCFEI